MSIKEQRRQKKLAKKRTKEVAKRKELARERHSLSSIAGQVQAAAKGAIVSCMVSDSLFENDVNIGIVLINRKLPDGRIVCVWFLIDTMCLGVKDHHALTGYPADMNEYIEQLKGRQPQRIVSPSFARKFVESAVAYAAQFDLQPVAGYSKLAAIWGDIDPSECSEEFEFGDENGRPRYINGPDDSPSFQAEVIERLERTAGKGNFDFVVMGTQTMSDRNFGPSIELVPINEVIELMNEADPATSSSDKSTEPLLLGSSVKTMDR